MRLIPHTLRRLSSAHLIALVALFVALGGTSYAAIVVTGQNIKDGSVTTADLKNDDVRGTDVRNETLTGADVAPNALRGGRINESTLGQVPSAKNAELIEETPAALVLREVEVVEEVITEGSNQSVSATAVCPEGKRAVGGGAEIIGSTDVNLVLTKSSLLEGDRWDARAVETDAVDQDWGLRTIAVCAKPESGRLPN